MKREERYVVIKLKDLEGLLTKTEEATLDQILARLERSRKAKGKPPLKCVVVESDWPEYEPVWKMLEERVDKEGG